MGIITVDFGGTMIKIGLFVNGELVHFDMIPSLSQSGMARNLVKVEDRVTEMVDQCDLPMDFFSGVAIAMPGIVDPREKKVLSINGKYSDAVGFDFRKWARDHLDLPLLFMENDANAALAGEVALGNTGGSENAALMILGTGVGTAAMIGGQLLRGAHFQAGCLGGHLIIDYRGSECTCGSYGCVEAETATWAIRRIVEREPGFPGSPLRGLADPKIRDIADRARQGDGLARKILDDLIDKWSAGAVNLIHAYDPEVFLLSGGVMNGADLFGEPLIEKIRSRAWTPYGEIDIRISSNPEQSVLFGLKSLTEGMYSEL